MADIANSIAYAYQELLDFSSKNWKSKEGRKAYFAANPDMAPVFAKAVNSTADLLVLLRQDLMSNKPFAEAVDAKIKAKYGSKLGKWDPGRYYLMAGLLESAAALNYLLEFGTLNGYDSPGQFKKIYSKEYADVQEYLAGGGLGVLLEIALIVAGLSVIMACGTAMYLADRAVEAKKVEENIATLKAAAEQKAKLQASVDAQAQATLQACQGGKFTPEQCDQMMKQLYEYALATGAQIDAATQQGMVAVGNPEGYNPDAAKKAGFFDKLGTGLQWGLVLGGVAAVAITVKKLMQ